VQLGITFRLNWLTQPSSSVNSSRLNKNAGMSLPKRSRNRRAPSPLWKRITSCLLRLSLDLRLGSPNGMPKSRRCPYAPVSLRERTRSFVELSGDLRRNADVKAMHSRGSSLSSSLANLNLANGWRVSFPKRQNSKSSSTPSRTVLVHWTRRSEN
jgi:hypothetical protein